MQTDFHASIEICPQKCMSELFDNKESRTLWKRRLDKQRLRDSTPSKQLDDSHTVLRRMPRNGSLRDSLPVSSAPSPFLRQPFPIICRSTHVRRNLYLSFMVSSFLMIVNVNVFHSCNIGHISLNALRTHPPGHDQFRLLIS